MSLHVGVIWITMTVQKMYPGLDIKADEVFVSDGSKCDIGKWNREYSLLWM